MVELPLTTLLSSKVSSKGQGLGGKSCGKIARSMRTVPSPPDLPGNSDIHTALSTQQADSICCFNKQLHPGGHSEMYRPLLKPRPALYNKNII